MTDRKKFYCVSSKIEKTGQLYGCFKIGPFSGHQSLTFANALRRTLLADTSRCTFSAVQIYGVEHEFSSLTGIRESVIDILLNLEKLIFQVNKPIIKPQVAFVNFHGPGILRACHINLPSGIKCIAPYQYIATLEVDGHLTLKLFFSPNWERIESFLKNIPKKKKKKNEKWQVFQKKKKFFTSNCISTFSFPKNFANKLKLRMPKYLKKSYSKIKKFNVLKKRRNLSPKMSQSFFKNIENIKLNQKNISKKLRTRMKYNSIASVASYIWEMRCSKIYNYDNKYKNQEDFLKIKSNQIQQNFIFLNNSLCTIKKVNYTIQTETKKNNNFNKINKFNKTIYCNNKKSASSKINFNKILKSILKKKFILNCYLKVNFFKFSINQNALSSSELLNIAEKKFKNLYENRSNFDITKKIEIIKKSYTLNNRPNFVCRTFNSLNFKNISQDNNNINPYTNKATEEFIFFEIWTDGSIHPQVAILRAINQILLEIFPYSIQVSKKVKEQNTHKKILIKRKEITNISKVNFRKKFLNLDIGNFYFNLKTYIFLKKKKIHRIVDFLNYLKKNKNIIKNTDEISITLRKFYSFIYLTLK